MIMPAVFGSSTINNVVSKGNTRTAQDMIGTSMSLRADAGGEMQNGHIGAAEHQTVVPASRAALIAAQDTPAIDSNSVALKWDIPTGIWAPGA
jgi:hypothetical protein